MAGGPIDLSIRYVETGVFEVALSHNRYTLLNTAAAPLWDICMQRGVAAVNAAPYGSGILAKGPERLSALRLPGRPGRPAGRARSALEEICARHGVPLAAAALQFSLRDPRITSTIVGLDRPELVTRTVELAEHPIPAELWGELAAVPTSTDDPETGRWR